MQRCRVHPPRVFVPSPPIRDGCWAQKGPGSPQQDRGVCSSSGLLWQPCATSSTSRQEMAFSALSSQHSRGHLVLAKPYLSVKGTLQGAQRGSKKIFREALGSKTTLGFYYLLHIRQLGKNLKPKAWPAGLQQYILQQHVSSLCCLPALSLERDSSGPTNHPKENKHCKKAEKNPLSWIVSELLARKRRTWASFLQEVLKEEQAVPSRQSTEALGALQSWTLSHVVAPRAQWGAPWVAQVLPHSAPEESKLPHSNKRTWIPAQQTSLLKGNFQISVY